MLTYQLLNDLDKLDHFTHLDDVGIRPMPVKECIAFLHHIATWYPETREAAKLSAQPTFEEVYQAIRRVREILVARVD